MRFYKTSAGQYRDYAYQLPRELMMEAITYNDQMINNQRNLLGKAEAEFLSFDSLDKDDDSKKEIISKYEGKIDELTKTINEDPMAWRSRKGDISGLGRELYKDWTMGDIHQITENLNARNTFVQNWKKLNAEKPDEYRSEDFNLALSNFDTNYKGYKSEDGDYQNYNTEELSRYINIDKFAEEMGEGYMADVVEKGGWWKNEKDGYYYHSKSKTERVTKEEIQQGLYQATMNDPDIWAYHDQMKKFYGDKGEDFSKNYINKIENAVDRVSTKYSYTKSESDTNQMQIDQYAVMKQKQEADEAIKRAKMNPIQKMQWLLSQRQDKNKHDSSTLVSRLYPSNFDYSTLYDRKEGLKLSINELQNKLKEVDKTKDPTLYDIYMKDLGEQKALFDNTNNFINNSLTLAKQFFPANQVADLEMYSMERTKFNNVLQKGDAILSLIEALDKPFMPVLSPTSGSQVMQSFDTQEQLMRNNKIKQLQNEFNSIKKEYDFAKINNARFGIITDYIEKSAPEFVENNTINYDAIDLSDSNKDTYFKKSMDNILLKTQGNLKYYKMENGTVTMDQFEPTKGIANNPFNLTDIRDDKGLNPSDLFDYHHAFVGQDADGSPTLNFVVSNKKDALDNNQWMDSPTGSFVNDFFRSGTSNFNFVMSIPLSAGSEEMGLFLADENPIVKNIAYLAQDPMSVMAFNSIHKLPRQSDYYTPESGDNIGIRGPIQTLSFYGGPDNGGFTFKINTIGTGGGDVEYEVQPVGKDVPSDLNSATRLTFNDLTKLFNEKKNILYSNQ